MEITEALLMITFETSLIAQLNLIATNYKSCTLKPEKGHIGTEVVGRYDKKPPWKGNVMNIKS